MQSDEIVKKKKRIIFHGIQFVHLMIVQNGFMVLKSHISLLTKLNV